MDEASRVITITFLQKVAFLANIALLLLILLPLGPDLKLYTSTAMVVGIFVLIWFAKKKMKEKSSTTTSNSPTNGTEHNQEGGNKSPNDQNPVLILSGIYAVVAGLALTQAFLNTHLSISNLDTKSLVEPANNILFLLIYLSIAIPFYHGATVSLVKEAKKRPTQGEERKTFFNFIILFVEAGILFFMANSLSISDLNNKFEDFIVWSLALAITDSAWVVDSLRRKDGIAPIEWLQLNVTFSLFLISLIMMAISFSTIFPIEIALPILLFIYLFRTVVDYSTTWSSMYFPKST